MTYRKYYFPKIDAYFCNNTWEFAQIHFLASQKTYPHYVVYPHGYKTHTSISMIKILSKESRYFKLLQIYSENNY